MTKTTSNSTHLNAATRRRFLKSSAVAASATMLSPWPVAASRKKVAATDKRVFATIGMRNQGWAITRKSFKYADFAALADVDSNVLEANVARTEKEQGKKPDGYKDYRKILERDDIDAVMIASPDHWHTKMSIEAMLAGKDVYCEKPLTLTIAEGKLIEKVVKQTGRVFQVGTMQRTECAQRFLQAIALVRDGRIGTIKRVTCGIGAMAASPEIPVAPVPKHLDWDAWLGPAPKVDYRALPEMRTGYGGGVPLYSNAHYEFRNWHEYAGGKLTDWGAHHVDIACWAIGATETGPSRVIPIEYELACDYDDGMPVEKDRYNVATSFEIKAEMPNDIELIIKSGGDNGILFEGSKGRFFVNRGKIVGKPIEDLKEKPLDAGAVEAVYGGPVSKNHTENFVQAMSKREQPISDVWSHNRMLEVCHLANIAMRLDRELKWDPVKREIVGDDRANGFLSRKSRSGFEIEMD